MKAIFIIIRFSILQNSMKGWNLNTSSNDFEEYRDKLFSDERMLDRLKLFEEITLESLISQSIDYRSVGAKVLILISNELPDKYVTNLDILIKPYEWIETIKVSSSGPNYQQIILEQLATYSENIHLATVRLDDDDALPINFLESIDKYNNECFKGLALSFGDGYAAIYSNKLKKIEVFKKYYYPKVAIGFTYFNKYLHETHSLTTKFPTVYHLGKHSNSDTRVPVIVDSRIKGFIRCIHPFSDTYDSWYKKIMKLETENTTVVLSKFAIKKSIL